MSHPSKEKGNRLERAIVQAFMEAGYECQRAWGSNGKSLGLPDDVDVLALVNGEALKIQAKSRKKIADFMKPPASCDATVIKEDRGEVLVVLRLADFLSRLDRQSC